MTSVPRRLVFVAVVVVAAFTAASLTILAVDIYLHGRYERSAGFNVWGYRGTPVGKKRPGEYRVIVLGGSTAYGYGVSADEAIPAVLDRRLREGDARAQFTVVNLAYNNEGAYSFRMTLADYAWLDYDLAVLYEGYNDLATDRQNVQVFRHESPVFRLTGYMPIFPIIFREKAAAMTSSGDPGSVPRDRERATFHASWATRAQAGLLDATAGVAQELEAQLGRVATEPAPRIDDDAVPLCRHPWGAYCRSIERAIAFARARDTQVLVCTQPYLRVAPAVLQAHTSQQAALRQMLRSRFASDPDVRYVDLGDTVNVEDARLSFDRMHLTAEGNARIAAGLVDPVREMAARRRKRS